MLALGKMRRKMSECKSMLCAAATWDTTNQVMSVLLYETTQQPYRIVKAKHTK